MYRFLLTSICLFYVLFATQSVVADTTNSQTNPSVTGNTLSQLTFSVAVPLKALQTMARNSANAANKNGRIAVKTCDGKEIRKNQQCTGDLTVTVSATPKLNNIALKSDSQGRLTLTIPIPARIDVKFSDRLNFLTDDTCRSKNANFKLSAQLVPNFQKAGKINYKLGKVSVPWSDYKCRFKPNLGGGIVNAFKPGTVPTVNVAQRVTQAIEKTGRYSLAGSMKDINQAFPTSEEFKNLIRHPAGFGGAVSLGIEQVQIKWRNAAMQSNDYVLHGVIEGIPWLQFGNKQAAPELSTKSNTVAEGFRLPARLLFPTDTALLPEASLQKVSACLGSFRLAKVPQRSDLSILQQCHVKPTKNIIWLSGDRKPPGENVLAFEQPIDSFLDQVVTWLDDPDLWRGVKDIVPLKAKVKSFQELLTQFQKDTQLPVEKRGVITFSELQIDLKSLWLTNEAILADVMLTGKAKLDLKVSL